MNHQQYKEWLPLMTYDELAEQDRLALEEHLKTCADCKNDLAELQKLQLMLRSKPAVSDEVLHEARTDLRAALRSERSGSSFFERISGALDTWMPQFRYALGAAAMLGVGLLVGYFAFHRETLPVETPKQHTLADFSRGNMEITNLKFSNANSSDGQVEFTFDAVTPMRIKGNLNDSQVQKVLSYALVNEQNPGVRLRAANALANSPETKPPDSAVKKALITAMTSDENPGVRKEALEALQKQTMDDETKHAFLQVLVKDKSPGLRVAAIKSLESERPIDQNTANVLRERIHSDDNGYVRMKAKGLLQEAKEQQ